MSQLSIWKLRESKFESCEQIGSFAGELLNHACDLMIIIIMMMMMMKIMMMMMKMMIIITSITGN